MRHQKDPTMSHLIIGCRIDLARDDKKEYIDKKWRITYVNILNNSYVLFV